MTKNEGSGNEELEEVLRRIESRVKSKVWMKNRWRELKAWVVAPFSGRKGSQNV